MPEKQYFQTLMSMHILCVPRNKTLHANAGFPIKLAEYLATGRPVIIAGVSDVAEYLGNDDAYIYDPEDPGHMEAMLRRILTDPVRAATVGQNGKRKAEMHFNASVQADGFMDFLTRTGICQAIP